MPKKAAPGAPPLDEIKVWMEVTDSRLLALEAAASGLTALTARIGNAESALRVYETRLADFAARIASLSVRVDRLEQNPQPQPGPAPGPRVPVGADVPLAGTDTALPSIGVRPLGWDSLSLQAAIAKAASGSRVVFLPAGRYTVNTFLRLPAGITLVGEGSRTVLASAGQTLTADGSARVTRLLLQGPSETWSDTNNARGIESYGPSLRVDNCEIRGFSYGLYALGGASLRLEACRVLYCLRAGLGYGLVAASGAWVRAADCELSQCRHMIASNGGGSRPTQWEAIHCRFDGDSAVPASLRQGALDAHPGMTGAFVVERCLVGNVQQLAEISDGTGLVTGCRFTNAALGWRLAVRTQDGKTGQPNGVRFEGNEWQNVGQRFGIDGAANCTEDGALLPGQKAGIAPPPPLKRLAVAASGELELR